MLAAQASLSDAFGTYEHEVGELVDLGDRVLAWTTFRAQASSGMEYEKAEAQIWTLRDGLITRFQWFHDRAKALSRESRRKRVAEV